jgi:hypothetical protein
VPVHVADYDRDDAGLAGVVPRHRPFDLNVVAVVRRHEVRADQEQDHVCPIELLVDLVLPVSARRNAAIVPKIDHSLALKKLQVGIQFSTEVFILVRVAAKYSDACSHRLLPR